MPTKKHELIALSDPASQSMIDKSPQPEKKTKAALLLDLISRHRGATLDELTSATGWLPHTVRAAITGLRKRGHDLKCQRVDGVSRYTVGSGGQ